MEFFELTEEEYKNHWKTHPLKTFLSSPEIAKLRAKKGWKVNYVGVKENNKIIASAMLLRKKRFLNNYEFYSPRGFLIDYNNNELLSFFIDKILRYIKQKKGYILRIDPYIINKERDINGDVVKNGINNKDILNSLKQLGFKKKPLKQNEQVTWMFSLNLEGKTEEEILKEMKQNTRNTIKKAEKIGIKVKELTYEELPIFNKIIKETGIRRNFTTKEKEYYEDMYKLFHDKNEVKYFITELNLKEYVDKLNKEKKENAEKLKSKNIKSTRKEELLNEIKIIENKISEANTIRNKKNNDIITLSGSMFMLIEPEIIYLSSGNYEEYMKFNSQYLIQWELIKYGIRNGFKKHNFYGIPENINEHPENYGIYEFKKGFNGYVEELIGEHEIPVNINYYIFKLLHKLKEVKYALHL